MILFFSPFSPILCSNPSTSIRVCCCSWRCLQKICRNVCVLWWTWNQNCDNTLDFFLRKPQGLLSGTSVFYTTKYQIPIFLQLLWHYCHIEALFPANTIRLRKAWQLNSVDYFPLMVYFNNKWLNDVNFIYIWKEHLNTVVHGVRIVTCWIPKHIFTKWMDTYEWPCTWHDT